jgi:leader peptidase (prepilin peptidase)/N-methyltransferase
VRISGWLIYKKETMGLGDVKLMVAVGTFIGCEKVLLALFIAVLFGSITGLVFIIFKKIKKNGYIPFGPFLSVASFIVLFIPKLSSFFNVPFIWEKCIL